MKIYKALIIAPLALGLCGCVIVAGDGDWDEHRSISNWESKQKANRAYTLSKGYTWSIRAKSILGFVKNS